MRVLMTLSNAFTHDPRVYNEALSLVKNGHQVTILAWDRDKKNKKREVIDGINVVRFHNTKFMDIIPYDIFRLHFWWKNGYKLALKQHEKKNFDVIHCHDLDTLPIGVKLKKKLGLPLIYDAHEIWGYMVARDIPDWWAERFLEKEKNLAPYADHIITVVEPIEDYFRKMGCNNVTIIRNCKRLENTEYLFNDKDVFTVVYIGSLNPSRFLLEAINVCKDIDDIKLIIGGMGSLESMIKERTSKHSNTKFIGKVPISKVIPCVIG
ncbi:MAG: glycosyltransferase [Thermoplasmata archaeon]